MQLEDSTQSKMTIPDHWNMHVVVLTYDLNTVKLPYIRSILYLVHLQKSNTAQH